jgi:glycosyltransferase involved in cell wall biosynthesis
VDEAELWIVGRPRMAINSLAAETATNVKWVPRYVSDPELASVFRRADVVVLPYLQTERFDFSGVLAAALAFGKPSVLSDVGGFSEVADTGAGSLVRPGDVNALAEALGAVLADPGLRERLASGARAAAAGPYSWSAAAEGTLALYRQLLG